MIKSARQACDLISRGRKIFAAIVLVYLILGTMELAIEPTEMGVARFAVSFGLLLAAWHGQQWAIALVALGSLIGALATFLLGLTSGSFVGFAIGLVVAVLYGTVFVLFLKSESLNGYLKHQALVNKESHNNHNRE